MIAWEKPITSEFITENYLTGLNGIMFDQPAFKPHTHDKNVCYQFTRDAAGVYLDGQPILDKSDIDVDGQNSDRINRVAKKLIDFTGSPEQALLVSRFANQDFGLSFIFKMLTGQLSQNNESFIRLGDGVPVTPVIPKSL